MESQITTYVKSLVLISLGFYIIYKSIRPKKGEELLQEIQMHNI